MYQGSPEKQNQCDVCIYKTETFLLGIGSCDYGGWQVHNLQKGPAGCQPWFISLRGSSESNIPEVWPSPVSAGGNQTELRCYHIWGLQSVQQALSVARFCPSLHSLGRQKCLELATCSLLVHVLPSFCPNIPFPNLWSKIQAKKKNYK